MCVGGCLIILVGVIVSHVHLCFCVSSDSSDQVNSVFLSPVCVLTPAYVYIYPGVLSVEQQDQNQPLQFECVTFDYRKTGKLSRMRGP